MVYISNGELKGRRGRPPSWDVLGSRTPGFFRPRPPARRHFPGHAPRLNVAGGEVAPAGRP